MNENKKSKIEARVKQIDELIQEKELMLLRGISDGNLRWKLRRDIKELQEEAMELLNKLMSDDYLQNDGITE